jgi:hypothetical protein
MRKAMALLGMTALLVGAGVAGSAQAATHKAPVSHDYICAGAVMHADEIIDGYYRGHKPSHGDLVQYHKARNACSKHVGGF